jgi:hypothetical protein
MGKVSTFATALREIPSAVDKSKKRKKRAKKTGLIFGSSKKGSIFAVRFARVWRGGKRVPGKCCRRRDL